MIRRRVVVHGRVQGVFFRASARQEAVTRDVTGWVLNRGDGTVEAAFEGAPEAVDALVTWSRRGPAQASVDHVEVHEEDPVGETEFRVT
ncbi:MAG TPA: acylphosphatase [Jiangellaceae bacterium]|nr:acylphosphatase [Jiangellaceae bacterium]